MESGESLTGVTAQLIGGGGALAIIEALGEALTLALFLEVGFAVAFSISIDLGFSAAVGAFAFALTLAFAFAQVAKLGKLVNALLQADGIDENDRQGQCKE